MEGPPITALADVLALAASPPGTSDRERALRQGAGGLMLHWLWVLPPGEATELAIKQLGAAVDLACEAVLS